MGLTQSAVSLQLQRLEAEFGSRLVDRSHQPLRLTPAGDELLIRSRSILAEFESAVDAVQRASRDVAGTLRLAASSTPGEYLVPALLAGFLKEHPAAKADLVVTDTGGTYALLVAARAAFGFVGARRDDLGLAHEVFARDEVILVGGSPAASGRRDPGRMELEEMASLPLIAREEGSGTLAVLAQALRAVGLSAGSLDVRLVAGSTAAQLAAVAAGIGYAFVSRTAVEDRLRTGTLHEVPVHGLRVVREILLAYDPARTGGALRSAFLEHVNAYKILGDPAGSPRI